jgi:serine/threonine protein phosphatase PrpC
MVDNNRALVAAITSTAESMANAPFDPNFSGTTLISVLLTQKKLWCANVGDSRALMGRLMKDSPHEIVKGRHWMSIALSRDHKPDEPDEQKRIIECGGRIEAYQDEEGNPLGPARVWLLEEDIPGLAMSRSLGDLVAASVGVSFQPEILEYNITPDDRFLVLGSDGVFEFLSNEEIVKIVVPFWK